jgi:large subunit ribosomal protein L30
MRRHRKQRETLIGLKLNRIGRIAELPDTPQTRGMIAKVAHLVRIIGQETELAGYRKTPGEPGQNNG